LGMGHGALLITYYSLLLPVSLIPLIPRLVNLDSARLPRSDALSLSLAQPLVEKCRTTSPHSPLSAILNLAERDRGF
jgi:hypothetical protein